MARSKGPPVDHSEVSGAPPAPNSIESAPSNPSGFLEGLKSALQGEASQVPAQTSSLGNPSQESIKVPPSSSGKRILDSIRKGREFAPPRILLVGIEGIGKSTWASSAPSPIFIQTEDGLGGIDCHKFPLATSYEEVIEQLSAISSEEHDYQTVVIDSVDWLERLIWDHVCRRTNVTNIERVGGGFSKGYVYALDEWREVLQLLKRCHERGMAIILIAHAKIERFEDPENPAYDRYSPRLHKHAQALLTEWVDAVLFATRKMVVKTDGVGFDERKVATPVGPNGGERIVRTVGSPACVAKNRYGLPPELPLSWEAFETGLKQFMEKK